MATARLERAEEDVDGQATYEVRSEPWNAEPFAGPKGRDWDTFQRSGDSASYEWRTGADRLRAAASGFSAGKRSVTEIMTEGSLASWLREKANRYVDSLEESEREGLAEEQAIERLLTMIANGALNLDEYDGSYSFYNFESDQHLAEAADALDLPRWARLDATSEGGPGSGYDQPCIVLGRGKTLKDLEKWLAKRAAP